MHLRASFITKQSIVHQKYPVAATIKDLSTNKLLNEFSAVGTMDSVTGTVAQEWHSIRIANGKTTKIQRSQIFKPPLRCFKFVRFVTLSFTHRQLYPRLNQWHSLGYRKSVTYHKYWARISLNQNLLYNCVSTCYLQTVQTWIQNTTNCWDFKL